MIQPDEPSSALSRVNAAAAAFVVLVSLLLPPVLYGTIALTNVTADMEADARVAAESVQQLIRDAPGVWRNDKSGLDSVVAGWFHFDEPSGFERLRIVDLDGRTLAAIGLTPPSPRVTRSAILKERGNPAGTVEIERSLRRPLIVTGLLVLIGIALATGSYLSFHVIPLQALRRQNTVLRERDRELAFAHTMLRAATEGALDAILIVDGVGRIVTYTQRFFDLWKLPPDLVQTGANAPVLAAVAARTKDPAGFLDRVARLYANADEEGRDRIELVDGRFIDLYTRTLHGPAGAYLGRIWFFRDVTESTIAEDRLKFANTLLQAEIESAPDAVLVVQSDLKSTSFNHHLVDMFGIPPESRDTAVLLKTMLSNLKEPGAYLRDVRELREHPDLRIQAREAELIDGRSVEYSGATIRGFSGESYGRIWFFRDVTTRRQAQLELHSRDALLHAVAVSAATLVAAPRLDEAISKAFATVGEALQIDRMIVMERSREAGKPPTTRYVWRAPASGTGGDESVFTSPHIAASQRLVWSSELREGRTVALCRSAAPDEFHEALDTLSIRSMLVVPIAVDGRYWGQISFDSFLSERIWRDFETEILRTLADLIGNLIQRERYVGEIADADRIIQNTPTILYRLRGDTSLPMIYVSQNVRLFGHDPARLIEEPLLYQSLVHPEDAAMVRERQSAMLDAAAPAGSYEFRIRTSGGEYRWVENRYTPIHGADGRVIEIEGLLIDITDRKAAEDKIALLARTDPLTGLANRNTFVERLRQLFAAARRGGKLFAVHYIDLDQFKDINDTLGHPVGDRFLIEVATRLKGAVREVDLVGRLGGDEFAILQAHIDDSADAGTLAARIRARLTEPTRIDGNALHATASMGIALCSPATAAPEDLLAQADMALYRAKEEGRDQYRFHTERLDNEVRDQVRLVGELRTALHRQEFELHYQPQIELATGRIVGMEALVRWRHPVRGLLPASEFVPAAERAGIVADLGRWVIDHACAQMQRWRRDGVAPSVIAVNVSTAEIKSADTYLDTVVTTLARWQIPAETLELDVSESTLASAAFAQNDVLQRLKKLGVRIAIEDFGTKHSSLDYVRTYQVNRLKIPRALTANAERDCSSAAMVRAIVAIARELNVDLIAQGVETESQWAFLTAASPAGKVQGYFYSEPVSPARAEELLRRELILPPAAISAG